MSKGRFDHLDTRVPAVTPEPRAAQVIVARKDACVPSRQGKRVITFYVSPETHKALKSIALHEDVSIQALMGEALDMLARSRGKHPFGER